MPDRGEIYLKKSEAHILQVDSSLCRLNTYHEYKRPYYDPRIKSFVNQQGIV